MQARTLELYRQLDLADEVVAARPQDAGGQPVGQRRKRRRACRSRTIGDGLTPYPFLQIFPQDEHEQLLIERLEALGVAVERQTELVGFEDDRRRRHRPPARAGRARGARARRAYIAGCDGARSLVRESDRRRLSRRHLPAGVLRRRRRGRAAPPVDGELHVDLDEADFLAVFPLAGEGRARLIGTVRDERAEHADTLKFEDVSDRAIQNLKVEVRKVNWFSTYHVHHRVTDHFRKGRAFLLGDAAHIHSPAGGQGMNTGIGDAINLAWKLAAVLRGRAPDEPARQLRGRADRLRPPAGRHDRPGVQLRHRRGPRRRLPAHPHRARWCCPRLVGIEAAREFMFRTVSQITLNYRDSPLSAGKAGACTAATACRGAPSRRGGHRGAGRDGLAGARLRRGAAALCAAGAPAWRAAARLRLAPAHAAAGLARDALYLLRPGHLRRAGGEAGRRPPRWRRYFARTGSSRARSHLPQSEA